MLKSMQSSFSEISKDEKAIEWAMNLIEIYVLTGCHGLNLTAITSPYIWQVDALNILNHNGTANPAANRVKITQREHVICLATLICMYANPLSNDKSIDHWHNCVYMATELEERLTLHFKPDAMSNPDFTLMMRMGNPTKFITGVCAGSWYPQHCSSD